MKFLSIYLSKLWDLCYTTASYLQTHMKWTSSRLLYDQTSNILMVKMEDPKNKKKQNINKPWCIARSKNPFWSAKLKATWITIKFQCSGFYSKWLSMNYIKSWQLGLANNRIERISKRLFSFGLSKQTGIIVSFKAGQKIHTIHVILVHKQATTFRGLRRKICISFVIWQQGSMWHKHTGEDGFMALW